ncbi:MAG: alanine--tRNA ligase [Candidatus Omnitrophota bacterium]
MKTSELRKRYLEFFKKKNHKVFASDTLVPDDASLLFTSAGMNQFKPYFLGEKKDVARAVSCQKCLRTGDLERVGETAYHHTFFEMLGNFSFGDYFKKEAIEFAWEFITKELNRDEKDLWVSVYKDDEEAYSIWKDKIGVPEGKIIKLGEDSNFWPANAPSDGPNGPCGPCSEIFFDKGVSIGCGKKRCNPDCSCGRFVEVWNLVFTEFNRVGVNKLESLPQKNIDTGMGLERMAAVLQGKDSNFKIDILAPGFNLVAKIVGAKKTIDTPTTVNTINAIVDHARAATFAIADGVYPSNEGRGYVIRKIIRKALWSANLLLWGQKDPFIYRLVALFSELMNDSYPEIAEKKDIIAKVIKAEEEKFLFALEEGKENLSIKVTELKKQRKNILEAEDAFKLYDTYGFPLELSKYILQKHNIAVDDQGFEKLLSAQRERSRKKSMFDAGIFKAGEFDFKEKSEFIGYDNLEGKCKILKLFVANTEKELIKKGEQGLVILDKTFFYAGSGGQLNDQGKLSTKSGEFKVDKVFKVADAIIHQGSVISGEIKKGEAIASVDRGRREALARAHTATHLLQAALRQVLGEHVVQQGSLVDEDKFRFDFTHFNRLADQEIEAVENLVAKFIAHADKVEKKELSLENAKKQGALAFFKDKYHNKVRMVSVSDYSKELCAGIHVNNTAEIGNFAIISESSISSGIRRIEAVIGKGGGTSFLTRRKEKQQAKKALDEKKKVDKAKIIEKIADQEEKFHINSLKRIVKGNKGKVNVLIHEFEPPASLRSLASQTMLMLSDRDKQRVGSGVIFIATKGCEKDIFICSATDDIIKKGFSCKKFISEFGKELSLKGGGNDRTVQGVIPNRGDDFIVRVNESITKFIKK